jgi:hypothetical protein
MSWWKTLLGTTVWTAVGYAASHVPAFGSPAVQTAIVAVMGTLAHWLPRPNATSDSITR